MVTRLTLGEKFRSLIKVEPSFMSRFIKINELGYLGLSCIYIVFDDLRIRLGQTFVSLASSPACPKQNMFYICLRGVVHRPSHGSTVGSSLR